jgi:alpha-1,2-mannosyltransferase
MTNFKYKWVFSLKNVFILLFVASLLQVVLGVFKVTYERILIDFGVYYEAVKTTFSGFNPYLYLYQKTIPFNYPPSFISLFTPLTSISPHLSQILFTIISILALILSVNILFCFFPAKYHKYKYLILALTFQNFPTKFTLVMGQINLIVLLLLILAFYKEKKGNWLQSGLFWGLAISLKLTPVFLIVYFLVKKEFKLILTGLLTFLILTLFSITLFPHTQSYYSRVLPSLLSMQNLSPVLYDQSLQAFLTRLNLGKFSKTIADLAVLTLLAMIIWKYIKKKGNNRFQDLNFYSALLILMTIGSSFAWQHHFVTLFPAFICQSIHVLRNRNIKRGLLLLICAILVGYHFPEIANPSTSNPLLVSHTLLGCFILFFLSLYS